MTAKVPRKQKVALVIEDVDQLRDAAATLLKTKGYKVLEAANIFDAAMQFGLCAAIENNAFVLKLKPDTEAPLNPDISLVVADYDLNQSYKKVLFAAEKHGINTTSQDLLRIHISESTTFLSALDKAHKDGLLSHVPPVIGLTQDPERLRGRPYVVEVVSKEPKRGKWWGGRLLRAIGKVEHLHHTISEAEITPQTKEPDLGR